MGRSERVRNRTNIRLILYTAVEIILIVIFLILLRKYYFPPYLNPDTAVVSKSYSIKVTGIHDPIYDDETHQYFVLVKSDDNVLTDIMTVSEKHFERIKKASPDNPVRVSGESLPANERYMKRVLEDHPGFKTSGILLREYTFRDRGFIWILPALIIFFMNLSYIAYMKTERFTKYTGKYPVIDSGKADVSLEKGVELLGNRLIVTGDSCDVIEIDDYRRFSLFENSHSIIPKGYVLVLQGKDGTDRRFYMPDLSKNSVVKLSDILSQKFDLTRIS